jgi:hypothetical protein
MRINSSSYKFGFLVLDHILLMTELYCIDTISLRKPATPTGT